MKSRLKPTASGLFVAGEGKTDHLPGGGRVPQDGNHEGYGSHGGRAVYNGAQEAIVNILRNVLRARRRHPIGANINRIQQRLSVKHGVITYMEEETCLILVAS